MLWKIRVLDQVLFAECISRQVLNTILKEEMEIAHAVVDIQVLTESDIDIEALGTEVLVKLN